jgi:hypothetical protein
MYVKFYLGTGLKMHHKEQLDGVPKLNIICNQEFHNGRK